MGDRRQAEMIRDILTSLPCEPGSLHRVLSQHVDDAMLREIASADFGHDVEQHLVPLHQLRDHGIYAGHDATYPFDVLELMRYSEPDQPDWKPGSTGEYGHWMRAFSAMATLRLCVENGFHEPSGGNDSLIQLIESLNLPNSQLDVEAAAFTGWLACKELETPHPCAELQVAAFIWFSAALPRQASDEAIIDMCEWDLVEIRNMGGYSGSYLKKWRELGARMKRLEPPHRSPPARDAIHAVGDSIENMWSPGRPR
jgi:hypothetical protein